MQKKYHVFHENSKSGPLDAQEVLAVNAARRGSAQMHIWSVEIGEWKPIDQFMASLQAEAAGASSRPNSDTAHPSTSANPPTSATPTASGNKTKQALVAFAVIAAAIGGFILWQKIAPQSVQGKILIVQKNAEVRKLALVKIEVLDNEQKTKWASSSQAKLEAQLTRASKSAEQIRARMVEGMKAVPDMNRRYENLGYSLYTIGANAMLLNIDRRNRTAELGSNETGWMNEMREHISKAKFLLPSQIDAYVADREFFKIYLAARYDGFTNLVALAKNEGPSKAGFLAQLTDDTSNLKESFTENARLIMYSVPQEIPRVATETSDGDGQFTVKLPVGDYTFVASSSRQVAESEEKYYWALGFTVTSSGDNRIMLGNQNLESNDPRSHWKPAVTATMEKIRDDIAALKLRIQGQSKIYKSPTEIVEKHQKSLQDLKDS